MKITLAQFNLFDLKNRMLCANLIANVIGVVSVVLLRYITVRPFAPDITQLVFKIHSFFLPLGFVFLIAATVLYERPIRRYLNNRYRQRVVRAETETRIQRRLLNEPFFLMAMDFIIWMAAAIVYSITFIRFGTPHAVVLQPFFISLSTGLITVAAAFFLLEHVLQRRMVPFFFPNGGLHAVPRTLHIRISMRLAALVFAATIVPFTIIVSTVEEMANLDGDPARVLNQLHIALPVMAFFFMGFAVWMTLLVIGNLKRPAKEIIRVLQEVRQGRFSSKVTVTSNDEIGFTGDTINAMNAWLKERDLIKDAFGKYVAREVRDEILSGSIPLDGEKKDVTILFADLRDFTPLTETCDPKTVVKIMNSYFKEMAEAIHDQGGLVLQFIGDEIYAVFGAPMPLTDHPVRAFQAGREMNRRLIGLNHRFRTEGWPPIAHGIGIHSGEALAATIGSPDRLSYLLVGDTVNLASRLQALTKEIGTELILSRATADRLFASKIPAETLKPLRSRRIKGKRDRVDIYTLA